jgi:L-aminopeptidase/D-esterase-like protein
MNATDLNTLLGIGVSVIAIATASFAVVRTVHTVLKNRRESRMVKVQHRVAYLQEKMNALQKASSDFEKGSVSAATGFDSAGYAGIIGQANAVMLSIGDSDLDTIAGQLRVKNALGCESENRKAIADGIKCLARIIEVESRK